MSTFFGSIWWLLVSIGILVTFHEFGHFLVARLCGVHVLRFSVGFGKPLLKRVGRDGTEYVVSAIPLGGYVKMLDEREFEVDPADAHRAFNRKPVWQRMAIALAGPVANFVLCFLLFWAAFLVGLPDYAPIVGEVGGMASQSGFVTGDRIVDIDGTRVDTMTDAAMLVSGAAMDHKSVRVEVVREDGGHATRILPLQQLGEINEGDALSQIGIVPKQFVLPAVVGGIEKGGPADLLRVGDRIVSIDGTAVSDFDELAKYVHAHVRAGDAIHLQVQRKAAAIDVMVIARTYVSEDGKSHAGIGIDRQSRSADFDALRRYGPVAALGESAHEISKQTNATLGMLRRIFTEGSTQGMSSAIGIARYANEAAHLGVAWFLFFLAILSLSLGIMNLLPVPILDGGHLLYYLIELVKGSPVSERTLVVGQYIGLAMLGGLMCLAFYNDLLRPLS
jgi:regulator of sigma E protease